MPRKRFLLTAAAVFTLVNFYQSNYEVPILMYHHVGAVSPGSGPAVTPETFERQMEFLKIHHYHVLSLEELVRILKGGTRIPADAVVITFDDGYLDNFIYAFPILKKMNFPATVFMITENIGKENWLAKEDLKILDESSILIGSHTVHHAFLPDLGTREEAASELSESKKALEGVLNHPVVLFSYPAGGVTSDVRVLAQELGYEGAVTTNYGKKRHDPFALHRIKVSESGGNLFSFWLKTTGLYQFGKKRIEIR